MAQYPTSPAPQMPYKLTENWSTIISAFDSGKEQRRQKQLYAKYDVELTYNVLSATNIATLWNFYTARRGSYEAFYFYTLESAAWTNLHIGTGDGSTLTFDIPGKSTSSQTMYINGSEMTVTTDYSILIGGGAESSDRVLFVVEPAENDIITCDFTGYMRIRCRFAEDNLSKQGFARVLYQIGVKLKGLTNV